jgi:hypothetical protein
MPGQVGSTLAGSTLAAPISEDIARRLNKSYWSDQEEQWAL